ncbi:hypothetical protein HMPREF1989_00219 [Porphyromonas gingivalis F0566]|nr:hypothetical protein HMPREF1989_00219 [Porphyromonas gingivalis F0566]
MQRGFKFKSRYTMPSCTVQDTGVGVQYPFFGSLCHKNYF